MSTLTAGGAAADLAVIGQESMSESLTTRVYPISLLNDNWTVQVGDKSGEAPTITISGSIGYDENNWSKVDAVVASIKRFTMEKPIVYLTERLHAASSGASSTRTLGRYYIISWEPEWSYLSNGSPYQLDWTIQMVELRPVDTASNTVV